MDSPDRRSAGVGNVRLGACGDDSNFDGESRDLAGGGYGQGRRHHRMDQQGHFRPYRNRAKRRLGCDDAAEEDRHSGFEEGWHHRLLLSLPSQYEGDPHGWAITTARLALLRSPFIWLSHDSKRLPRFGWTLVPDPLIYIMCGMVHK